MITAYHGTTKYFTTIDPEKFGKNNGAEFGAGLYLTTEERYAESFRDTDKGLLLTGNILQDDLFENTFEPASNKTIERLKNALTTTDTKTSHSFNAENLFSSHESAPITHKDIFEKVGNTIADIIRKNNIPAEDRETEWAKAISTVFTQAGYKGIHDKIDTTIVIFSPEDLPNLSLHSISRQGRPTNMPESISIGSIIVPTAPKMFENNNVKTSLQPI